MCYCKQYTSRVGSPLEKLGMKVLVLLLKEQKNLVRLSGRGGLIKEPNY